MSVTRDDKSSYRKLRDIVDPWSRLGSRQYANGTWRIGHIPHVAPEAYLHQLLPPITRENLDRLQWEIGIDFPNSLCNLLFLHNGLMLFDYVIVHGKRTSYNRSDIDAMMEQPYDMVVSNTLGRPENAPDDVVFVGSLGDERQLVAIWPDGSISLWDTASESITQPIYKDIFSFLLEEAKRAQLLFDSSGRRLDSKHGDVVDGAR